jgi:hypothetical protein
VALLAEDLEVSVEETIDELVPVETPAPVRTCHGLAIGLDGLYVINLCVGTPMPLAAGLTTKLNALSISNPKITASSMASVVVGFGAAEGTSEGALEKALHSGRI